MIALDRALKEHAIAQVAGATLEPESEDALGAPASGAQGDGSRVG